jgi:hypothetical protein
VRPDASVREGTSLKIPQHGRLRGQRHGACMVRSAPARELVGMAPATGFRTDKRGPLGWGRWEGGFRLLAGTAACHRERKCRR